MTKPLFVGLSGKKQTGKDTTLSFLENVLHDVQNTSFAWPLKEYIAVRILGIPRELAFGTNEQKETPTHIMWDSMFVEIRQAYSIENEQRLPYGANTPKLRSGPMTVREVLQVVGADWYRRVYPDVWVDFPFRQEWNGKIVVITDCRFPNEVEAIKQHGGVILRLERDTSLEDSHPSEKELDNYQFDHVYSNNGSLEDLEAFVTDFAEQVICSTIPTSTSQEI